MKRKTTNVCRESGISSATVISSASHREMQRNNKHLIVTATSPQTSDQTKLTSGLIYKTL